MGGLTLGSLTLLDVDEAIADLESNVRDYVVIDCNSGNVTLTEAQSLASRWAIINPKNDNTSVITVPLAYESLIPTFRSVYLIGDYFVTIQLESGGTTAPLYPSAWDIVYSSTGAGCELASEYFTQLANRRFNDVVEKTDATYTFAITDAGTLIVGNRGTAQTFTIPADSTAAFRAWSMITVKCIGVGSVTIDTATGVTLNGTVTSGTKVLTTGQECVIAKQGVDVWFA